VKLGGGRKLFSTPVLNGMMTSHGTNGLPKFHDVASVRRRYGKLNLPSREVSNWGERRER
jgi:hypothetical protein